MGALLRVDLREAVRELVVSGLSLFPLLLALERGHLALPALALGLLDLRLHSRRGRRMSPRLLALRHALLSPIAMLGVAMSGARGAAVMLGAVWALLAIAASTSLRASLPLIAGGTLLALTVPPDSPRDARTLRIATYNLEHVAMPPQEIVEVLRGLSADVVAVQELVDRHDEKPFDLEGYIARHLRMHSASALLWHEDHGHFGVGIFSRYPIVSQERLELPYVPRSHNRRHALKAVLDVRGRRVTVVSAHLDRLPYGTVADNRRQIHALAEWVSADAPVALCGDFNAFPVFSGYHDLERRFVDARIVQRWPSGTWPSPLGLVRMDWIFVRGLEPLSQRVVRTGGSDHFPVVADLRLLAPGEPERSGDEPLP